MGRTSTIASQPFKDKMKILRDFFSPSKVYPYSNYLTIKAENNKVEMILPLIIGEAISTGCMAVHLDMEVDVPFEVIVPCKDFLDAVKVAEGRDIYLESTKGYLELNAHGRAIKIPLATETEGVPAKIRNDFSIMRKESTSFFDIESLNDILNTIGKEIKAQTVDYAYHGIYITDDESYVTNGMSMTKYNKGMEGKEYYIPYFALKLFKSFSGIELESASKVLYDNKSPFLYCKSEDVDFYIQEWMSKDVYPNQAIRTLFADSNYHSVDTEAVKEALLDVTTLGKFAHINFQEGVITDEQKRITADIPKVDLPNTSFAGELLPRKADFKKIDDIRFVVRDDEVAMIYLNLGDVHKMVAKVEVQ